MEKPMEKPMEKGMSFVPYFPRKLKSRLLVTLIALTCASILTLHCVKRRLDQVPSKPKILCYVLLSRGNLIAGRAIKETWGRHCDELLFFGNYFSDHLNMTRLHSREGYPYLWNKTKSALLHLYDHYATDFDWFLKADHDTFVWISKLRGYVAGFDPGNPIWLGYKLKDRNMKEGYHSGGAGYVLSKAAMQRIGLLLTDLLPGTQCKSKTEEAVGYEDIELGKCAIEAGIESVDTRDKNGGERFLPLSLSALLSKNISNFHWIRKQAWNPLQMGTTCCSLEFITMHQISPPDMRMIYYLLFVGDLESIGHHN